ncbi:MAG TPA: hypothetical protein VF704_08945 [Allosphingosinicella sp.]
MSDRGPAGAPRDREQPLGEIVDAAARRVVTGLVIAAGVLALGIYSRPGPPRYQAIPTDTGIIRVDTGSGTVLHCVENGCYTVVRRGQDLLDQEERRKAREKAFGDEPPPTAKALSPPQPEAVTAPAGPPTKAAGRR